MKNLPCTPCKIGGKHDSVKKDRRQPLQRLRHQSRWAALCLYLPWLWTILSCRPVFYEAPLTLLGLLPGLAAAVHIHYHLSHHLACNHHRFMEDNIYATLGAANWITLLRAAAAIGLAGFLPSAFQSDRGLLSEQPPAWTPGIIYLGISMLDLLDGYVARRQERETELGKKLDIVTDAAGLMAASLLAVALGRLPFIYLLVGLAYYSFVFSIWLRQRRGLPVVVLQPRPYARITAGCQMGLVAVALLPIFNPAFNYLAAYIFMIPLLGGFLRDWLVVSCRIKTDANQQSKFDLWMRSLTTSPLPLILRVVIFSSGIAMFADYDFSRGHLGWQLAIGFCCLLAIFGLMGRSAGLFLMLLLGSNQSPMGMTVHSTILFTAAAALLLTGTGTMSLWAPEERIIYRRSQKSSTRACEVQ